jgi:non-specific serine/threonine protein kinase
MAATIRRVADALHLDTAARADLFSAARVNDGVPPKRSTLPLALTSFVGRERELAELADRLTQTRLLTLTGVGGCGKTRLALEVARTRAAQYRADEVRLIELGSVSDPAMVPQQVALGLEVRERPEQPLTVALVDALRSRPMLLVLDNCEHLLHACAQLVHALLRGCSAVQVLATSREPIGVDGELVWYVPSLRVPDEEDAGSLPHLADNAAVRLFVDRVALANAGFRLTGANAMAIVQICRRLDGLPLALELAAARMGFMTAAQLATRLDQRFRLLTGASRVALPRQQTLQATLDWSYTLLSRPERRLFERLSVFSRSWTLEAAEVVGSGPGVAAADALELLAQLVRKSLVVARDADDGMERYAFLETVREYARQKFTTRGVVEVTETRERHARFYSEAAQRTYSAETVRTAWMVGGPAAAVLRDQVEDLTDNLRIAIGWWLETGQAAKGLRLGATVAESLMWRGRNAEARRLLEAVLDLDDTGVSSARASDDMLPQSQLGIKARAMSTLGILAMWQGDYADAAAVLDAAASIARAALDARDVHPIVACRGLALVLAGDESSAIRELERCRQASCAINDHPGAATALRHLALIARWQTHCQRAAELLGEALTHARQSHPNRGFMVARTVASLGRVRYLQGMYKEAATLLAESFDIIQSSRLSGQVLAEGLDWMAALVGMQGKPGPAACLFGAADAHWRLSGMIRYAPDNRAYECDVARVRDQLEAHTFNTNWERGRAMHPEQAVAYAVELT